MGDHRSSVLRVIIAVLLGTSGCASTARSSSEVPRASGEGVQPGGGDAASGLEVRPTNSWTVTTTSIDDDTATIILKRGKGEFEGGRLIKLRDDDEPLAAIEFCIDGKVGGRTAADGTATVDLKDPHFAFDELAKRKSDTEIEIAGDRSFVLGPCSQSGTALGWTPEPRESRAFTIYQWRGYPALRDEAKRRSDEARSGFNANRKAECAAFEKQCQGGSGQGCVDFAQRQCFTAAKEWTSATERNLLARGCKELKYEGACERLRAQQSVNDRERQAASDRDEIVNAARGVVSGNLKAPSQASWGTASIIDHTGACNLVKLAVDAPNSFGVMLRNWWLVTITRQGAKLGLVTSGAGPSSFDHDPSAGEVNIYKSMTAWANCR